MALERVILDLGMASSKMHSKDAFQTYIPKMHSKHTFQTCIPNMHSKHEFQTCIPEPCPGLNLVKDNTQILLFDRHTEDFSGHRRQCWVPVFNGLNIVTSRDITKTRFGFNLFDKLFNIDDPERTSDLLALEVFSVALWGFPGRPNVIKPGPKSV